MNAGRDVERLIAGWLAEEAAPGAPDRVLESTRQVVRRTNQRRFAALWRESMFSPMRAAALTAALVLGLVGGVFVGRLSAPAGVGGPQQTPAATPTAAAGATIASYRAARNAICKAYLPRLQEQNNLLDRLYDPALSEAERAPKITALQTIVSIVDQTVTELEGLEVPADMLQDHAAQVVHYQGTISLLRQAIAAIRSGDLSAAQALDLATDPNSRAIEAFESKYGLAACP
jgi:hypothetical protein